MAVFGAKDVLVHFEALLRALKTPKNFTFRAITAVRRADKGE
jgi:hypothetical protein